jgi:hypothetical protein
MAIRHLSLVGVTPLNVGPPGGFVKPGRMVGCLAPLSPALRQAKPPVWQARSSRLSSALDVLKVKYLATWFCEARRPTARGAPRQNRNAPPVDRCQPFGVSAMIRRMRTTSLLILLLAAAWTPASAQTAPRQTQDDDYTRYELLAPGSGQFRILYEVTATTPGARFFFNTIRPGSVASNERVTDPVTGRELKWEVVKGAQAKAEGHPGADASTEYIKVHLARPVPAKGEARVVIDKTYTDAKSYYRDGDAIVFDRSLGIRRNSVVLPAGYQLVGVNVPSQVIPQADGRLMVSFMNPGPAAAPLLIRAKPGLATLKPKLPTSAGPSGTTTLASQAERLDERAHQDREIVYFPNDPATHSFSLYHDYTETRPGVGQYFNVVRKGSTASDPSAILLDTGESLKVETIKGAELQRRGIDPGDSFEPSSDIVVISFPPVKAGESSRLRIAETYTDPARYYLDGDELVWDRAFGRPRNAVVLPAGWTVVASAIPAVIATQPDGRQRLDFENNRPDEIQVLIRARRQVATR